MADFENLGFETPGASPGLVGSWATTTTGSVQAFGDFSGGGGAAPRPHEGFEGGWDNDAYLRVFGNLDVTVGQFNTGADAAPFESFEIEWDNSLYLTSIAGAAAPLFTGGSGDKEPFEVGWDNDTYLTVLGGGDVAAAAFTGGDAYDSFESGWGNDAYQTTLADEDVELAFINGDYAPETFEAGVYPPRTFVVLSNVLQVPNHIFLDGMTVVVAGPGLANGLIPGYAYSVVNATTHTLQLALTFGGSPVTISDSTFATATIRGNPAVHWTEAY